jgi:hypothetical protein
MLLTQFCSTPGRRLAECRVLQRLPGDAAVKLTRYERAHFACNALVAARRVFVLTDGTGFSI